MALYIDESDVIVENEKIKETITALIKCNERCGYTSFNNVPTSSMLTWLKNQNWSEEDEMKRTLLIKILEVNHPHGLFKINSTKAMPVEELVSWLKSL